MVFMEGGSALEDAGLDPDDFDDEFLGSLESGGMLWHMIILKTHHLI